MADSESKAEVQEETFKGSTKSVALNGHSTMLGKEIDGMNHKNKMENGEVECKSPQVNGDVSDKSALDNCELTKLDNSCINKDSSDEPDIIKSIPENGNIDKGDSSDSAVKSNVSDINDSACKSIGNGDNTESVKINNSTSNDLHNSEKEKIVGESGNDSDKSMEVDEDVTVLKSEDTNNKISSDNHSSKEEKIESTEPKIDENKDNEKISEDNKETDSKSSEDNKETDSKSSEDKKESDTKSTEENKEADAKSSEEVKDEANKDAPISDEDKTKTSDESSKPEEEKSETSPSKEKKGKDKTPKKKDGLPLEIVKRVTRSSSGIVKPVKYIDPDPRDIISDDDDIKITKEVKKDEDDDIEMIEESDPLAISVEDVKKAKEANKGTPNFQERLKSFKQREVPHKGKDSNVIVIDTNTLLKGNQSGMITHHAVPKATSSVSAQTTTTTATSSAANIQTAIHAITGGNPAIQGLQSAYLNAIQQVLVAQGNQASNPHYIATLQQYYNTLGALQDDAYVIEAPSFIVPYVMEGKPVESIKDYQERLKKEDEEEEKKRLKVEKEKEKERQKEEKEKASEKEKEEKDDTDKEKKVDEGEEKMEVDEVEVKEVDDKKEKISDKEDKEKISVKEEKESEEKKKKEKDEKEKKEKDEKLEIDKEKDEKMEIDEEKEEKDEKIEIKEEELEKYDEKEEKKDEKLEKKDEKLETEEKSEDKEEKLEKDSEKEEIAEEKNKTEEKTPENKDKEKSTIAEDKDKAKEKNDDNKENKSEQKEGEKKDEEVIDLEKDDLSHLGRWESYYKSSLGKFFLELGLNHAQEFIQADLLKMQKRRVEKLKTNPTKQDVVAIKSLERQLNVSKARNAHLYLPLKMCKFCSYKTESGMVMERHLESPHMINYTYKCNFCEFETRGPQVILFHTEAEHNVRGRLERAAAFFQCPLCPFEDNNKSKMTRHSFSCSKKFKADKNSDLSDWEPPAKIPKIHRGRPHFSSFGKTFDGLKMPNILPKNLGGLSLNLQNAISSGLLSSAAMASANSLAGRGRGRPVGSYKNITQTIGNRPGSLMYQNRGSGLLQPMQGVSPQQLSLANQSVTQGGTNRVPRILPASNAGSLLPGLAASSSITIQSVQNKSGSTKSPQQPSISITPLPRGGSQSSANKTTPTNASNNSQRPAFVICEICDGYIKDLEQLRNHMNLIHKVKIHPKMIYNRPPLNCQKCQHRFFTDQGLERHLLGTHGLVTSSMQEAANKGKDAGRCPICGKVFQWKLLNHVSRDHKMTLKPAHLSYKCTVCTATFNMYRLFENHVYSAHSVVNKNKNSEGGSSSSTSSVPAKKPTPTTGTDSTPLKINDEITIIPQPATKSSPKTETKISTPTKKNDSPSMSKEITITKVGSRSSSRRSGSSSGSGGVEVISLDDSPTKRQAEDPPKKRTRDTATSKRARTS